MRKPHNTLPRGAACAPCRQRKRRCDAATPYCSGCIKSGTQNMCTYRDRNNSSWSNTTRLEWRVDHYEHDPIHELDGKAVANLEASSQPMVSFHDFSLDPATSPPETASEMSLRLTYLQIPDVIGRSHSVDFGRPLPIYQNLTRSNESLDHFEFGAPPSRSGSTSSDGSGESPNFIIPSHNISAYPPDAFRVQPSNYSYPPSTVHESQVALGASLMTFFLPNMQQTFLVNTPAITSFLSTTSQGTFFPASLTTSIHPALQNAIFLWATYFASAMGSSHAAHGPTFLLRVQNHLTQGLQSEQCPAMLDILQAAVLTGLYLVVKGRSTEASYYVSSAISLAINLGLHQLSLTSSGSGTAIGQCVSKDDLATRVEIWWNVYGLDKIAALAANQPPQMLYGEEKGICVTTPWQQASKIYEQDNSCNSTLDDASFGDVSSHGLDWCRAVCLKGAVLANLALRTACKSNSNQEGSLPSDPLEVDRIDHMLSQHMEATPPYSSHYSFIFDHTTGSSSLLCATGRIYLHVNNINSDLQSRSKCIQAAQTISQVIQQQSRAPHIILTVVFRIAETALTCLTNKLREGDDTVTHDSIQQVLDDLRRQRGSMPAHSTLMSEFLQNPPLVT